jgi:diguanylate cyclase (GGDEF)-like protein
MPVGHDARLEPARPDNRQNVATRLGALADIARAAWAGSRADLLRQAAGSAREALDSATASVSRWDAELGELRVLVNVGDLAPGEESEPVDEVYTVEAFHHLRTLVETLSGWMCNVDHEGTDDADVQLLVSLGKHCSVGVPIPLEGRTWGELYLTRTVDQPCFDDADTELALLVAAQIGAALATADHLDSIDKMARTDPLTGLGNRRAVDEALDAALTRHLVDGAPVSLVVCDLNGLKRINDEQGHEAGDRALIRFGAMLSSIASSIPGSLAARLGGDEFCIVVPEAGSDAVVEAAGELCRLVLKSPLEGVSCGVASTADDVGSVESGGRLFRLADAAQYRAKRSRATVPIVAGRGLPNDVAAHHAASLQIGTSERRMFRGRDLSDTARLLRSAMTVLEDSRDHSIEDRLVQVAEQVSEHCQPLGWWLSVSDPAMTKVRTIRHAIYRTASVPSEVEQFDSDYGNEYLLAEYPQTAKALSGRVVTVQSTDPDADPSELAMLDGVGAVSLLMAGVVDAEGTGWLIEIIGDAMSEASADLGMPLRALMTAAALEART